ncbi:DUF2225 domain-containing protein [Neobacillus sp. PS3-40]|uniref:DUF2225 domain-containing protein n=1 Tax=Neobacillus sp. PS3-40 TaxID=3070679 RepID=UPI0027DF32C0|nr:DUF2225 domain-containing protein [Neobacillus sp. PS3-40]WML45885.1 DUF2225 domain-containing protein [Neobacillus sp. PS3-40]
MSITIDPIFDKKYECLLCKKSFTSKKVRSRFVKITHFDTDFSPNYESDEANPLFYHIQICPACGFSFSDDFSKYFLPGTIELIQKEVTNRWVSRDFGSKRTIQQALQTYKLAIYCGTLKKEKHIVQAGMYMRIAWLYRSKGSIEEEQRFLKLSIEEYEASYIQDDFRGTQVSVVKLMYLIGELSIRINDVKKAVKYFSKVIEKQKQTVEPKIIEMARERWHEIREKRAVDS